MTSLASPPEARSSVVERLIGATGEPALITRAARALVERALPVIAAGLQERLSLNLAFELTSIELIRLAAARPDENGAMTVAASTSSSDALNLSMDGEAASVIVGTLFGGDPDVPSPPIGRALSPTEADIATVVFEEIAKALNGSGARSLEIKLPLTPATTGAELQKKFLRDGPGVRVNLAVSTPASSGRISLVMPQRVLLKHRGAIETKDGAAAVAWRQRFNDEVMRSSVDLEATMPLARMTLGQVAGLYEGQIIELEGGAQSQARLSARQKTLFVCEFGKLGQNYTVRIRHPFDAGQELMDGLQPEAGPTLENRK
jgi:flagellar motor switch protein FliM